MNNIKKVRLALGIKQKELAALSGLSAAAISKFENSKGTPSIISAYKIAKSLGKDVEEIFPSDIKGEVKQNV